jgi:hypothetical protein
MNKKAIISTILVVELILLILLTFSNLRVTRGNFSNELTVTRIATYRLSSTADGIAEDINYLKTKGADNDTLNQYISFVNTTFGSYFDTQLYLNQSTVLIKDRVLSMQRTLTV